MSPVAVPKSVELFNRLADLELGDHEQAMELLFELRKQVRSRPRDATARGNLAKACLIVGYRDEAIEHLNAADGLWGVADLLDRGRIAELFGRLGDKSRGIMRSRAVFDSKPTEHMSVIIWNCTSSALRFGDLDLLDRIGALEVEMDLTARAGLLVQQLNELGLIHCFPGLQAAVSDVVAPYAMDFALGMSVHPDDGRPFLSMSIQIDASQIHRLDLSDDLSDRLDALAEERDDMPDDWWWRYFVTIEAAPRHPSIPAAPRRRRAA